jgi:hypothetical protein
MSKQLLKNFFDLQTKNLILRYEYYKIGINLMLLICDTKKEQVLRITYYLYIRNN